MRVLSTPELNEISGGNFGETANLVQDVFQSRVSQGIAIAGILAGSIIGTIIGTENAAENGTIGEYVGSVIFAGLLGAYGGGMFCLPIALTTEGIVRTGNYIFK